jgi:glycosyltransferase involved in cell wall biosynthesis
VVDLVAGLERLGHKVRLIHGGQVPGSKLGRVWRMITSMGSRDRYIVRSLGAQMRRLGTLIQKEMAALRPDVIHCHEPYSTSAAAEAVGRNSIPIVETVHGPALYEAEMGGAICGPRHRDFVLNCERRAFAAARRIIAVDSGQGAILRNDYAVDPSRIAVIFNSVNVAEVRRLAAAESFVHPPEPYFLVPRRLVLKTGVRYAIEALARMEDKTVRLVIAGRGSLRSELESLAKAMGLEERTLFLGHVPRPQLLPLFRNARGVVIPSVPAGGVVEATSVAAMEAMACGTVAIASNIGGLAELIEDGVTGLLVRPANPDTLAAAMTKAMFDLPLRQRILDAARRKVETDYDTAAWLDKTVGVYNQALAGR